jgi:hypothetical protein
MEDEDSLIVLLGKVCLGMLGELFVKLNSSVEIETSASTRDLLHSSREKIFKLLCLVILGKENGREYKVRLSNVEYKRKKQQLVSMSKKLIATRTEQKGFYARFNVKSACDIMAAGSYETMPYWPYGYLGRFAEIGYGPQNVNIFSTPAFIEAVFVEKIGKENGLHWFDSVEIKNCRAVLVKNEMFRIELGIRLPGVRKSCGWYVLAFHCLVGDQLTSSVGSGYKPTIDKMCYLIKKINRIRNTSILESKQLYNLIKELIHLKQNEREKEFMELCKRLIKVEGHKDFTYLYKSICKYWAIDQGYVNCCLHHIECRNVLNLYFRKFSTLDNLFGLLKKKCLMRKIEILAMETPSIKSVKVIHVDWGKRLVLEFWNTSPFKGKMFVHLRENAYQPEIIFLQYSVILNNNSVVLDRKMNHFGASASTFIDSVFQELEEMLVLKLHNNILKANHKHSLQKRDSKTLVLTLMGTSAVYMIFEFNRWLGCFDVNYQEARTNSPFSKSIKASLFNVRSTFGRYLSMEEMDMLIIRSLNIVKAS